MPRLFTNGPNNIVVGALQRMSQKSRHLHLAAPYFDYSAPIEDAAKAGKSVKLLIGLNSATSPDALDRVRHEVGVEVRYFTHRFHAKIFVFDDAALVGSANLTHAGLHENREAMLSINAEDDSEALDEVRGLFAELWEDAAILSPDVAMRFRQSYLALGSQGQRLDSLIEEAVGRLAPKNIDQSSRVRPRSRVFIETLQRELYGRTRPAFMEVAGILEAHSLLRPEIESLGVLHQANRFLNWVRLEKGAGDTWQEVPLNAERDERRHRVEALAREWQAASEPQIPANYSERLSVVRRVFGEPATILSLSAENLLEGLRALHAFEEQLRFTSGGGSNLAARFWAENGHNTKSVARTLAHLVHGQGEFAARLHDLLFDAQYRLRLFGRSCATELVGSVRPEQFVPTNGRIAKGLRTLGYDVPA